MWRWASWRQIIPRVKPVGRRVRIYKQQTEEMVAGTHKTHADFEVSLKLDLCRCARAVQLMSLLGQGQGLHQHWPEKKVGDYPANTQRREVNGFLRLARRTEIQVRNEEKADSPGACQDRFIAEVLGLAGERLDEKIRVEEV